MSTLPMAAVEAAPSHRPRTGRAAELGLLVFAVLIVVIAEGIVDATTGGRLDPHALGYGAALGGVALVAHLVLRVVAPFADPVLLPSVLLLNGLSLVMIHRLDIGLARAARENGETFDSASAGAQVLWTAIGLGAFLTMLIAVRDHRAIARYAYTLALVGLVLLVLPSVLPARFSEVNGSKLWIRFAGFSIQPGEVAKLCLIAFAAAYLVSKRDVLALAGRRVAGIALPRGRDLGPLGAAWVLCIAVLASSKDLGTSLMFFGLFVVLLYVATERVGWVAIGALAFGVGAFASYFLYGRFRVRVDVWLHPFDYTSTIGYQLTQSLFGLGTGGLFGTGWGGGRPETVPVAKSDFIISSFGEELGLFGLAGMLMMYGIFVARGFSIALLVRDAFGKLLAAGLAFSVGFQAFVVVAGVTRALPETGLTTPFLSYGGSSLVANYAALALLLRISDAARRPAQDDQAAPPAQEHQPALARLPEQGAEPELAVRPGRTDSAVRPERAELAVRPGRAELAVRPERAEQVG
ncbi:MAG: FtsW/RodA/SpoVE family cell cycle protein [Frankiaceae bacterium]|jgi:cell division protein FtsW (lipid II flippase)|nr:FtsW/RodA/SpoVE family cell cycle protein [Frankiaceae bacterium]